MSVEGNAEPRAPVRAAPQGARTGGQARAGRAARRGRAPGLAYTRFVGLLKVVLPALALGILLLLVAWPRLGDPPAPLAVRPGDESAMLNARYVGTDEKDRPFSVVAERAVRSASAPELVDLVRPEAEMTLEDGTWIFLRGDSGRYNEKTGKLLLLGSVDLIHDDGYEFRTDEAHVNVDEGTAWGDRPVQGQGPFGEIFAQGFRLFDKGQTVVFTGRARLNLAAEGGADGPSGGPAEGKGKP